MVKKAKIFKWAAKALVIAMLLQPAEVYAWGDGRGGGRGDDRGGDRGMWSHSSRRM